MPVIPEKKGAKHIRCGNCGAKLRYWPNDVKKHLGTDIRSVPAHQWVDCPHCGGRVHTAEEDPSREDVVDSEKIERLRQLSPEEKLRVMDAIADFSAEGVWEMSKEELDEVLRAEGLDPDTVASDILGRVRAALEERGLPVPTDLLKYER